MFLWRWLLSLISEANPAPTGSERRFRCCGCSEVGFFHADPPEDTVFEPKCAKCGAVNRLYVTVAKPEAPDA